MWALCIKSNQGLSLLNYWYDINPELNKVDCVIVWWLGLLC